MKSHLSSKHNNQYLFRRLFLYPFFSFLKGFSREQKLRASLRMFTSSSLKSIAEMLPNSICSSSYPRYKIIHFVCQNSTESWLISLFYRIWLLSSSTQAKFGLSTWRTLFCTEITWLRRNKKINWIKATTLKKCLSDLLFVLRRRSTWLSSANMLAYNMKAINRKSEEPHLKPSWPTTPRGKFNLIELVLLLAINA